MISFVMDDIEKEWEDIFDEITVREITQEDKLFVKYSILLFLRICIDNSPKSEVDPKKLELLKSFIELISNQVVSMSDEIIDDLLTKALKCGKIEEFSLEKTTNKLIH